MIYEQNASILYAKFILKIQLNAGMEALCSSYFLFNKHMNSNHWSVIYSKKSDEDFFTDMIIQFYQEEVFQNKKLVEVVFSF